MATRNKARKANQTAQIAQTQPDAPAAPATLPTPPMPPEPPMAGGQGTTPPNQQPPQPTPQVASQAASAGAPSASTPAIRKGIYLSALVYIEGDQPPAADFAALTTAALKKRLANAFSGTQDGLSMALKRVDVQNNVEENGGDNGTGGIGKDRQANKDGGEKFQF